jgi:glycosyltransferase involved in cell wall biosynthesis
LPILNLKVKFNRSDQLNPKLISVIICSGDRKDYILDAVRSIVVQSLPRNYYEIIVVKGFKDDVLDSQIDKLVDLIITSEEPWQGPKWRSAIIKSRGDLIAFLDDDDLFFNEKLETIYRLFNETHFGYFRNEILPFHNTREALNYSGNGGKFTLIDENDLVGRRIKTISKKIFSISSSSTVVSRPFLTQSLNHLEEIKIAFDSYLFYLALHNNERIVVSSEILTLYRKHMSFTSTDSLNIDLFKEKIKSSAIVLLHDYKLIRSVLTNNKELKKIIDHDIFSIEIPLLLSGNKKTFSIRKLLSFLADTSLVRLRQKFFYLFILIVNIVNNKVAIRIYINFRQNFSRQ